LVEIETKDHWNLVALEAENSQTALRSEKWKKVARNWLADYADKRARDFVLNVINEVVKLNKSAKVLDIGCGPGKWSIAFAKQHSSVTAIDSSKNMISLAEANAKKENLRNLDFRVMNVSKLDLPNEAYDLVNCVTVLQHVFDDSDWRKAIHELGRVTKKNGHVLLFEVAPSFALRRRTSNLSIRTMKEYISEFEKAKMCLVHWRGVDLSLPVTYLGLKRYAASFNKKVYYFMSERESLTPQLLSFLSRCTALLAGIIDYKLAETPLSFLSFGRILLFRRMSG
jgi:ubiquinone/menaquinone biosynthesis C-methylase UbiE